MKDKALELFASNNFCTIATVDESGQPEAAVVGFSQNDKLELMIGADRNSRKLINIGRNNKVAVTVGPGADHSYTVQYEGLARIIKDEAELTERLKAHFEKLPSARQFLDDPGQVWLVITPTWLRVTLRGAPDTIEETRQFS